MAYQFSPKPDNPRRKTQSKETETVEEKLSSEKSPLFAGLSSSTNVGKYDAFGRTVEPGDDLQELPSSMEGNLNYRYQYRFWREGNAKGCVTNSDGPVENPHIAIIVPTSELSAWELPPSELEWAFRHTASYAVSVLFLLGSILFVIGCAYDLFSEELDASHKRNLIRGPFFFGTLAFVFGSYAGVFEVLNVGNFEKTGKFVWWKHLPDETMPAEAFWTYWCFFVGSLIFMIPPIVTAVHSIRSEVSGSSELNEMFEAIPYAVGSVFFVIAGFLEMEQNGGFFKPCCGSDEEDSEKEGGKSLDKFDLISWHLAIQNWFGSALFLYGGVAACYFASAENYYGTKIPFLIGSLLFLVSSILGIWLWKDEKFGLGKAAALTRFAPIDHVEHAHGDRREVKWWDAICVVLSIFGLSASLVDVCFAFTNTWSVNKVKHTSPKNVTYLLLDAVVITLLLLGICVLASSIYRVPDRPEFSGLIKYLRLIVILLSFTAWAGFENWLFTSGHGRGGFWPV